MRVFHIEYIVQVLYKILLVAIGGVLLYLLFQSINGANLRLYVQVQLSPVVLLIGTSIYMGALFLVSYIMKFLSKKAIMILSIVFLVAILVGLIWGGHVFRMKYFYDIEYLHTTASEIATGKTEISTLWYLERYPHQWHAALFLSVFYAIGHFFGLETYLQFGYIMSYIFIWLSAFFSWLSIRRILNDRQAAVFLFAFFVNPIFYMYASYCYTDTLCMPFIYAMIYFIIVGNTKTASDNTVTIETDDIRIHHRIRSLLFLGLAGFIGCFGFYIRATNGIPIIAALLFLLLQKEHMDKLKKIMSFTIGICIAMGLWNGISHVTDPGLNPEAAYPIEHWIVMGTDAEHNGLYSVEAEKFTHSFETHEGKVLNDRNKMFKQLGEIGPKGMGQLILRKLTILWTDGTNDMKSYFSEQSYLGSMDEYVIGHKQLKLRYLYQFVRAALILSMLIALILELKKKAMDVDAVLWISFFGVCLFYVFWEVMSRYSMSFIPMLIMLQAVGIGKMMKYEKTLSEGN